MKKNTLYFLGKPNDYFTLDKTLCTSIIYTNVRRECSDLNSAHNSKCLVIKDFFAIFFCGIYLICQLYIKHLSG